MCDYIKQFAEDTLISIGAIKYFCDIHESGLCDNYMDKNEVYAKATSILKAKYPDMNDFKFFHECIDEVLSEATADYCPFCEKAYNE